ncbi:hypothetical protein OIU78_017634 [Salix suchowensis]|nr:hypothetical protein OIU78_017634 [Salix suchowensis]
MECQPIVFLRILSENEAWALFKINAGLRDEDSNLNTVAEEVARECQGLPIALVTVGRALRDKSTVVWEVASKQLKNSQFKHMELIEDYNIPMEDLTRYAVGYGIHQDVESIEDARKQVYVEIKTLKDCCMLLGTKTEEKVKMHDLVRDIAIQIASKEHGFMVKAGIGLKEWPRSNKSFEGCTTISLMGNQLIELPEGLVFPQLKVLLLELDRDLNVPEKFFEGMKEIEVLSLEGGCLSLQSLEFSMNLQSLQLIECECKDLIWLRKLQRLQILGFIGCSSLEELPDEIGELKELRLLDVLGCRSLRRIPANSIGRLKKLEEVLIGDDSFQGWDVVGCDSTKGMNTSLKELNLLSHLAVLSLKIPRVECLPKDFVFPRLLKYDIVLGNGYSKTAHPTSPRLYLNDISAASLNAKTFEQLFPTVSQICFIDVEDLENIVFGAQMTSHGSQKDFLQRLEDVKVKGCRDTRTLFQAKWRQAFNNLTSVEIEDCKSLEEVFEMGEGDEGCSEVKELRMLSSLTRLLLRRGRGPPDMSASEVLFIWSCGLFTSWHLSSHRPWLKGLTNLRVIRIIDCERAPELMQVGSFGTNGRTGHELSLLSLEKLDLRSLPDMRCIWKGLVLSHLTTLEVSYCQKLTHVFTGSMVASLVQLKLLVILACEELEQIIAKDNDDEKDQILSGSDLQSLCFPNLREIFIMRCNKLRSLFPVAMAAGLSKLEDLDVRDSSQLLGVFWQDDHASPVNVEKQMVFPNLSSLRLYNLQSIVCFSLGCDDFLFPRLGNPMVDKCPKFANKANGSTSAQLEVLLIRLDFMPLF